MRVHKRIISMILIIGLLIGNLWINPVEAKTVEVKIKSSNAELKISLLNEKLDYRLGEVVFRIKNKTNQKVKVTNVSIQFKVQGEWQTLQKRKKTVGKRKTVIVAQSKVYDSINLSNDYIIPENGLDAGKYSIYIKYKYKGEYLYKRKTFYVEGLNLESTSAEQETTTSSYGGDMTGDVPIIVDPVEKPTTINGNSAETPVSATEVSKAPGIKIKLVNTDFSINKKGKASVMVFSEADYKKAKKTKIYISVQRKVKGKWRKYKVYKITKKSNIAFLNKQLKLKKKGTYRMWVKVTFYGNGKKPKQYKTKSKSQVY